MIKTNKQPLPREEQLELVRRAQAGCIDSRNLLIETNLPLLNKKAMEESDRWGFDVDDLVMESVFAMISAIERFDFAKSDNFMSYAATWIKQRFQQYRLAFSGICRVRHSSYVRTLNKAAAGDERAQRMLDRVKGSWSPKRVDDPDIWNCDELVSMDAAQVGRDERRRLHELMAQLPERERLVLELRYMQRLTLEDCRDAVGVTRERVRQIQEQALRRLQQAWDAPAGTPMMGNGRHRMLPLHTPVRVTATGETVKLAERKPPSKESTTWFKRYSKEPLTHGPCSEHRYRRRHSDVWFRESELEEINNGD